MHQGPLGHREFQEGCPVNVRDPRGPAWPRILGAHRNTWARSATTQGTAETAWLWASLEIGEILFFNEKVCSGDGGKKEACEDNALTISC